MRSAARRAALGRIAGGRARHARVQQDRSDRRRRRSSLQRTPPQPQISLSARTGAGIELLREHFKASAGYRDSSQARSPRAAGISMPWRARAPRRGRRRGIARHAGFELFAEDLRLAQRRSARSRASSAARICWRNLRQLLHRQMTSPIGGTVANRRQRRAAQIPGSPSIQFGVVVGLDRAREPRGDPERGQDRDGGDRGLQRVMPEQPNHGERGKR